MNWKFAPSYPGEMPALVEYVTGDKTFARGYVIDQGESPITGRYRLLVADRPGDDPATDGTWIDASECQEVTL